MPLTRKYPQKLFIALTLALFHSILIYHKGIGSFAESGKVFAELDVVQLQAACLYFSYLNYSCVVASNSN
ncbi:hypothetical protein DT73_18390 [Mangrovibacter sp. MFB070]|nr:hypothetical protein DT73_18390 [Mangrovibacter sp. MFB070]